jgi:hypothetical protein
MKWRLRLVMPERISKYKFYFSQYVTSFKIVLPVYIDGSDKAKKIKNGGCNASVIQRPKALVEPLDGSKFWRNLLRLNKYRSR